MKKKNKTKFSIDRCVKNKTIRKNLHRFEKTFDIKYFKFDEKTCLGAFVDNKTGRRWRNFKDTLEQLCGLWDGIEMYVMHLDEHEIFYAPYEYKA